MQRWIFAGLGAVGLVVMFFGALYAKREYHLRQPDKKWVPITLRADISLEDHNKIAEEIDEKLRADEILRSVVADVGLQEKFNQPSEDAAVKELNRRLFCEIGTTDTPKGSVPSINVGISGIRHETKLLGDTSTHIARIVLKMLGIDPDTGKPINPDNTPPSNEF